MAKRATRADLLLVERGLAPSRARAQALIMAGEVFTGDRRVEKAGERLATGAALRVRERPRFVSRGGDKLQAALDAFGPLGLTIREVTALDIGASTGGFTDCLLQAGANRVYAVDVGWGQLHERLRQDARVVVRERTNARHLKRDDFAHPVDLVVVDASFIGLGKLIDAVEAVLKPGGDLIALVKPQFEAGRRAAEAGKGVIRDPNTRRAAIANATADVERAGFIIRAGFDCPLPGPKGNVEYLLWAKLLESTTQQQERSDTNGVDQS